MTDTSITPSETPSKILIEAAIETPKRPAKPDVFPVLEKLAELYPPLFGAVFVPLKRGIFQDLLEAHPEVFEKEMLKNALAFHTRSTRYLGAVAAGKPRHDLSGKIAEEMAPLHVYQALMEIFRRRKERGSKEELIQRIVQAWKNSGLTPQEYADIVRSRNEAASTILDEAMAEVQTYAAKAEALKRAYQSSGKTIAEFAEIYGMDVREVKRLLH
jgi:sRNA-binding protein